MKDYAPERFAEIVLGDGRYAVRYPFPKWNIRPTVLQEPRLFPRVFPELSSTDHAQLSETFESKARRISEKHHQLLERGRRLYGTEGSLISGGFREHWPEKIKNEVRQLAHASTLLADASRAHAKAAKLRSLHSSGRDRSRKSARRDPGGPGKYIVKISSSRYAGEYSGGATLAEAVVEARRFKPRVGAGATIRVGYFTFGKSDPEDGRFHVSRTIQRGS